MPYRPEWTGGVEALGSGGGEKLQFLQDQVENGRIEVRWVPDEPDDKNERFYDTRGLYSDSLAAKTVFVRGRPPPEGIVEFVMRFEFCTAELDRAEARWIEATWEAPLQRQALPAPEPEPQEVAKPVPYPTLLLWWTDEYIPLHLDKRPTAAEQRVAAKDRFSKYVPPDERTMQKLRREPDTPAVWRKPGRLRGNQNEKSKIKAGNQNRKSK
jgi:hypothetical protein